MEEQKKEEKKPDVTVIVVNFVKDLAKDYFKKIAFAAITGFAIWGWASFKSKADDIASLPKKYELLLDIRSDDSTKAMAYYRADSIKDLAMSMAINSLTYKLDSVMKLHNSWLMQDADSIDSILRRLKRNKIR